MLASETPGDDKSSPLAAIGPSATGGVVVGVPPPRPHDHTAIVVIGFSVGFALLLLIAALLSFIVCRAVKTRDETVLTGSWMDEHNLLPENGKSGSDDDAIELTNLSTVSGSDTNPRLRRYNDTAYELTELSIDSGSGDTDPRLPRYSDTANELTDLYEESLMRKVPLDDAAAAAAAKEKKKKASKKREAIKLKLLAAGSAALSILGNGSKTSPRPKLASPRKHHARESSHSTETVKHERRHSLGSGEEQRF